MHRASSVARARNWRSVAVQPRRKRKRKNDRSADAIVCNGGDAFGLACDVSDYGSVAAALSGAAVRFGTPDILVNNAGVIEPIGPLVESDPAAWRRNIASNLDLWISFDNSQLLGSG